MIAVDLRKIRLSLIVFLLTIPLCLNVFVAASDNAFAAQTEEERTAMLVEGAKKERKLLWYVTIRVDEVVDILNKFKEKYPFIETEFYRSGDEAQLTKVLGEARAKKYSFDVLETTGIAGEIFKKSGLFGKYLSPQRKFFPEASKDKDPEGYWTDYYVNYNVIGYNAKLVSTHEVPKNYNDLLYPKWKGKMGMDDKAFYWFANVLKIMGGEKNGLEYMKKLAGQNIQFRTGRNVIVDMLVAGEFSIGITTYNQRVEEMKAQGAPLGWVAIEPIVPEIHPIAISAHAPHPNAAKLFVDFMLSREGQEILSSWYRIPSRIDVDARMPGLKLEGLKILPFDTGIAADYDRYIKLYREILMKK